MKNLNLIKRLWTDSHEKQSPQRFGRYAAILIMLLTLGVGQMWADGIGNLNYVSITGSFNSWANGSNAAWFFTPSPASGTENHYTGVFYLPYSSSNREMRLYMGRNNAGNSNWGGSYAFGGYWLNDNTWYNVAMGTDKDNDQLVAYSSSPTSGYIKLDCEFYGEYSSNPRLKIDQSEVAVLDPDISADDTSLDGEETTTVSTLCTGGSGTYNYSYVVTCGGDDVTASTLDATSGSSVTFTAPTAGTEKTYRVTVTASDAHTLLSGLASQTDYVDITVAATLSPVITWAESTPISSYELVSGESVTLKVTRSNSSANITYKYKVGDGSWQTIVTQSGTTYTYTPAANNGATKTYYFKAVLNDTGSPETSVSSAVTQYGKKTIHVRNTNDWSNFYVYRYNSNSDYEASWHGTKTIGISDASGQWKDVVMTSKYAYFIFNDGGSNQITGSETYRYASSIDDGGYYIIQKSTGSSLTFTSTTEPTTPTVTTDDLSASAATTAVFGAHLTAVGNDKVTVYGIKYKQSDSNLADAAAIEAASPTTVPLGTNKFEAASGTTNQTITAGKDYYYIAYATNGFGTTYGVVRKLRTTGITLNKKGGSSGSENFVALGGKTISAITAPTKTGYNFAGYWTSENDESGTKYFNANGSANVSNWPTNLGASLTLYAHWTAKKYDVTLKLNGGTGTDDQVVEATYDANMPLVLKTSGSAISVPTRIGYTLQGYWDTDAASGGTQYYTYTGDPKVLGSARTWNKTSATNLHARWQANTYTLTLKKYNGQDDAEATATYDATISVTPPTKTGYTFKGYYTASSGGTQIIAADGHFVASVASWTNSSKQWNHTSDETLHAQWIVHTYTIEFDGNEDGLPNYIGEVSGSTDAIDATYDVEYTLTANGFSREGYTFAGWNTDPDGTSGDNYDDEEEDVSNLTDEDGGTVTLYAKWTGRTYTVTFDARGGSSLSASSSTVTMGDLYINGSGLGSALPTVTPPAGYVFQGWYTASTGGTLVTDETRVTTASDHTLYAHYIQQTRVYFYNNLSWDSVFVTYDAYWDNTNGSGNLGKIYHKMTQIEGTDIWYDVIPESVILSWQYNICFNSQRLGNVGSSSNYNNFDKGKAVFRRDFDSYATMFVPDPTETKVSKNSVQYYSTDQWTDSKWEDEKEVITDYRYKKGYWRTYNEKQAGYVVKGSWDSESKDLYFRSTNASGNTFTITRTLDANTTYTFRIYKHCKTSNTYSSWFINNKDNTITGSVTDYVITSAIAKTNTSYYDRIKTTAAGDYTITLNFGNDGVIKMDVTYPLSTNDYRVLYSWNDGSAHTHVSEIIKPEASSSKKISVFVHKASDVTSRSLKIQQCTAINASGVPTWTDRNTIDLSSVTASGVYNFVITQPAEGYPTGAYSEAYDGDYYIRTECAEGKWDFYKDYPDNKMTYSDYSMTQTLSPQYSHYFCRFFGDSKTAEQTDIAYTIATDYSPSVSDTLVGDETIGLERHSLPSGHPASVRFSWNEKTNALRRAYLKSATGSGNKRYLLIHGNEKIFNNDAAGTAIASKGEHADSLHANELQFIDKGNWIYQVELKAQPQAAYSLIAKYNGVDRDLIGNTASREFATIIGGSGDNKYAITAVYDFKTNRLMTAWTPSEDIKDNITNVDVMLIREGAGSGNAITFGEGGSLTTNKIIGAIKLDYDDLVGKVANWTSASRPLLKYFISFPFAVNVSDIFGMGRLGREYIIQRYNGAERARKGFFRGDGTTTFWENLTADDVMNAYEGYCVIFDNDYLNDAGSEVWTNKGSGSSVYLYFPSADNVGAISNTDKTIPVPEHECKIERTFIEGGKTLSHQNTDSHWNLIGVPIFNNHEGDATAGTPGAIFVKNEGDEDGDGNFHYYYEFNPNNTFSIAAAFRKTFNSMHCYMVQYHGDVTFTGSTPTPAGIAARRTPENKNYKIELQVTNGKEETTNHTYVELRENASDDFALNEDVYMDLNNVATSIYSYAGDYDVAANVLSVANHTVSVGINVVLEGLCTFSMPSNFSGTVTLIDKFAQTRTNLALEDYEVYLNKGTFNDRFELEIDINKMPTAIDGIEGGSLKDGKAHKFIQNGQMYILKNGVLYDARGNRLQ